MQEIYKIKYLDIRNKKRNLNIEAQGNVKSTKYFPVFLFNGEEYIFKPLSKTKPLTTPLFAFSEVFWSYVINHYFDSNAPQYYLAIYPNMETEQSKYYNQGVLVKSVLKNNQRLINIYEYLRKNPDTCDISNYTNYCMMNYDYTNILETTFLKENPELGNKLAFQILLSILRQDQNFHFENINFIEENEKIIDICPPLDFEFSTMFLYPDQKEKNELEKNKYLNYLNFSEETTIDNIVIKNIAKIVELYPKTVKNFISKLEIFLKDIDTISLKDPDNYINKCNSNAWQIGYSRYKLNDENKAKLLELILQPVTLDKAELFQKIKNDIKENTIKLLIVLKTYYYVKQTNNNDFTKFQIEHIFNIDEVNDIKKYTKNNN